MTVAEKILSAHAGREVHAGEIAVCDIDFLMIPDSYGMFTVKSFREMGGERPFDPQKVLFALGSNFPPPNERIANLHKFQRDFALETGVCFAEGGEGICHEIMRERGCVHSGDLIIGGDSHTCIFGAWGAYGSGMGGTDMAGAMLSGKSWFKVPETIRIDVKNELPEDCCAKDVILTMIGTIGASGGDNKAFEFHGDYFEKCSEEARMTIASMIVDMGGETGFICTGDSAVKPDEDAVYCARYEFDLSTFVPCVAKPGAVDNYAPVAEAAGTPFTYGIIGSCTNGQLEDLRDAADILRGKKLAPGVRLMVVPSSRRVMLQAAETGILKDLSDAGAYIFTPSCACCSGTHAGIPADGETVLSSTPRNQKGRMGNPNAEIYLAGPKVIAASCITGVITAPLKRGGTV